MQNVVKVGIREFREHLPQYLLSPSPVAITRHGETMGFYVPVRHYQPAQADIEALKKAILELEKLLSTHGITADQLIADFRDLKRKK